MPIKLTTNQARALTFNSDKSITPRMKKNAPNEPLESDIQRLIVDQLRLNGYFVSEIGQYFQRQREVNSVGYPDLSVRKETWPCGMALLLEVKRPGTGRLSAAQKEFYDIGGSQIVHNLEEALSAVEYFENSWMQSIFI